MTTRKLRATLLCGVAAGAFMVQAASEPIIVLPMLGLFVACSNGQTAATITQTVITDAADVANGLATFAAEATNLPNATAIMGYAQDAVKLANTLALSMTESAGATVISQIQSDVAAVGLAVNGLGLSTQASNVLTDVELALQILLPLVGLLPVVTGAMAAAKGDPAVSMGNLHSLPTVTIGGVKAVNR